MELICVNKISHAFLYWKNYKKKAWFPLIMALDLQGKQTLD
jgi:hypothetical protein